MKILKILLISIGALSLFACNIGDGADVQNINGVSNGNYSITGTATNCRTTPSSCQVSINYYGSNSNYQSKSVGYLIASTPYNTSCPNTTNSSQPCSFTINGTGISTATTVNITINSNTTAANFTIGGGLN